MGSCGNIKMILADIDAKMKIINIVQPTSIEMRSCSTIKMILADIEFLHISMLEMILA